MSVLYKLPFLNAIPFIEKGKTSAKAGTIAIVIIDENDQKHESLGQLDNPEATAKPAGYCVHWAATPYNQAADAYHVTAVADPVTKAVTLVLCVPLNKKGQHLWGRNSGIIGVSLACARGAVSPTAMGKYPATPEQIEALAIFIAEHACMYGINPMGTLSMLHKAPSADGQRLVATGQPNINVPVIADHATYAKHDGYADARWDASVYYPLIHDRAIAIYRELKGASSGVKMPNGEARTFLLKELWDNHDVR